ncbi:MAG: MFS transporter [Chloroflexi bacterium]|nr:MFS transporter [Chloroflexota bacterium]
MKSSVHTFYLIIITQTLSLIGSSMTGFAIGIKVFNDTGQVTPLALVGFFSQLPRIISASFAGVLADRWDRRKVLIMADAGQAVGTFILLLAFATDNFALWILYLVVFIQAIFEVLQSPALSATVTMLVPDEQRDLANTIQQINRPAANIVAPIIAGLLFVVIGVTGVMALDLISFFVAIGALYLAHIPRPKRTAEGEQSRGSVLKEAWSGFKFMLERRLLMYIVLYAMLLNFLFNAAGIMMTPYVLTLTGSEAALGAVIASLGAGMVAGGIAFSMWRNKPGRIHVVFWGIIICGFFLSAQGIARTAIVLMIVNFLLLFPNPAVNASLMSLLQIKTPPDMQGRVFASLMQLAMLATPLAFLIAGPLADEVLEPAVGTSGWAIVEPIVGAQPGSGMGLLMVINGMLVVVTGILLYSWKPIRGLENSLPDYIPEVEDDMTETVVDENVVLAI